MVKKVVVAVLVFSLCFLISAFAEEKKDSPKNVSICPVTKMSTDCLSCHVMVIRDGKPAWGVIEVHPEGWRIYPEGTKVVDGKGYFYLTDINSHEAVRVSEYFNYLNRHKIKHAIIDIYSPGGSLFAGWRIKAFMEEFELNGGIVETRLRGLGASAAAIIFVSGTRGYRIIDPQSYLMFHELYSIKLLDISTPSDKEEEARILRLFQDNINLWLALRGKLTKAELDERCKKKEFWMTGNDAKAFGYADHLITRR